MSILLDITPYSPLSVQLTWRRSENKNNISYNEISLVHLCPLLLYTNFIT